MLSIAINLAGLRELMARRGIPNDEGLALHHFLSETFGKRSVQPFRLMPGQRKSLQASLYGYSEFDEGALQATAEICAVSEMMRILGFDTLKTKTMPIMFSGGKRLGFDVRVRSVRRLKNSLAAESREMRCNRLKGQSVKPIAAGSEVDAFLLEPMRSDPELIATKTLKLSTREEVYKSWLSNRFGEAAELNQKNCRVARYERRKVRRGGKVKDGPDVTFHGELIVKDPYRFSQLIVKGVGRHTAYGYGMLLLRPPGL